jgi:hypothetical protein
VKPEKTDTRQRYRVFSEINNNIRQFRKRNYAQANHSKRRQLLSLQNGGQMIFFCIFALI